MQYLPKIFGQKSEQCWPSSGAAEYIQMQQNALSDQGLQYLSLNQFLDSSVVSVMDFVQNYRTIVVM